MPIYGRVERKYRIRENRFLSDSRIDVAPFHGRPYKDGELILLVAVETTSRKKSLERLIVGRKEQLSHLIAAFDRVVRKDHPNPERAGCPSRPVLTALAKEPGSLDSDSLLEHIRNCVACVNELKELRLAMKRSR